MSLMMMLVSMTKAAPVPAVSVVFTSTQNFIVPAGVTVLESIVGKGADGMPAYNDPDISRVISVARVVGEFEGKGSAATLSNWDRFTLHANGIAQRINAGGSGSDTQGYLSYVQFAQSPTGGPPSANLTSSSVSWTNAVAGTASASFISWGHSGAIMDGDNGEARVAYKERGAYHPATTGLPASAFGKTFPGGTGGTATTTSYTNVPVSAGQTYQITVPTGGSVTITYRK